MKPQFVCLLVFLTCGLPLASEPQQHAPTVGVCRADAALWYDRDAATDYLKAEALHKLDSVKNPTPVAKLPLTEVKARATELFDCGKVDDPYHQNYLEAADFYYIVMVDRYGAFIRRHQLMEGK